MKIGLLTLTKTMNYGGTLQAYALERFISENGYECEYINYNRNRVKDIAAWFFRKIGYEICRKNDNPSWRILEFLRESIYFYRGTTCKPVVTEFEKFWKKTKYSSIVKRKELKSINKKYDLFIVGSDQVWQCGKLNLDTTYLLDFVDDNDKKASYASSFGLKEIPMKYVSKYRKYLNQFRWISSREKSGSKIIEEMTGEYAKCVIDPTLLLTKDDWLKIMYKEGNIHQGIEPYILMYILDESLTLQSIAEELSRKKGFKIKYVYADMVKNVEDKIGPVKWLELIESAEYVITNSFHGVVFSINFNKEFFCEITNKEGFQKSSNRIDDLLEELNLKSRLMSNPSQITEDIINYNTINEKLADLRQESMKYLIDVIETRKGEM